jgi:hypothetical protein
VKGALIAVILVSLLASCERNAESHTKESSTSPTSPRTGEAEEQPVDPNGGPVLVEKKPPVAEPVEGQPGMVVSPFNGKLIDVKGIQPGTLVADPTYPIEEKKYFRVPELPEGSSEPPKLLDPGILIRPNPPKEEKQEL